MTDRRTSDQPWTRSGTIPGQVEDFNGRLAQALIGYDQSSWESDGEVPRQVFFDVGATAVIRERWRLGARGGLETALLAGRHLARVDLGFALALSLHSEVFTHALVRFARTSHLVALSSAAQDVRAIGCVALTEDDGGSALGAVSTTATRDRSGKWHLQGTKAFVTNALVATHALVLAQVDGTGPCLFIVEMAASGVEVVGTWATLGVRSVPTARVRFNVRVKGEAQLTAPGAPTMMALAQLLSYERLGASGAVIEAARMALEVAVAFAAERRTPAGTLLKLTSTRQRIGACEVALRSAEALISETLRGLRPNRISEVSVAACKYHCARVACTVTDEALQILGGRGYSSSYPVERIWRDVRLARIGGGTDEVMLAIVAGAVTRTARRGTAALIAAREREPNDSTETSQN